MPPTLSDKRVCVTGGAGFLGRAVCERLRAEGVEHLFVPRSNQFDLTQPQAVARMFDVANPEIVIHLAAEAIVTASASHNDPEPVNLGTGREITSAQLAAPVASSCGLTGKIMWDRSRSDGQPRRQLDTSRAAELFNWKPKVDLQEGLHRTIDWWRAEGRGNAG